jgi:hypothetical protein
VLQVALVESVNLNFVDGSSVELQVFALIIFQKLKELVSQSLVVGDGEGELGEVLLLLGEGFERVKLFLDDSLEGLQVSELGEELLEDCLVLHVPDQIALEGPHSLEPGKVLVLHHH